MDHLNQGDIGAGKVVMSPESLKRLGKGKPLSSSMLLRLEV